MQPLETIIVVVAMVLGYKLLMHVLTRRDSPTRKSHNPKMDLPENPQNLQTRADELLKRLTTLEEIIASESPSKRS